MEIKKSAAISFGTGGKTLFKKQSTPRSLLDSLATQDRTERGDRLARNMDTNVHARRADVDEALLRANL